ncbi:MAG: peptidoglycan DD-metalloendopeptidase family protein [Xanthomonadaceae bacterium]|nr:peptidoglycan DD-metalloendopeptidase family protein [Xanthomonadaceae bacterium]
MAAAQGLKYAARGAALALACAVLVACAAQPGHWRDAPSYTVRSGDTVYSIAFRHGLDWRNVARWNGIDGPGYLIRPGQVLQLHGASQGAPQTASTPRTATRSEPSGTTAQRPVTPVTPRPSPAATTGVSFQWPADGELIARGNGKGIAIAGSSGQAVRAAAAGRVVYTGSGLIGYGELIIVKHNNQLLSAYAHNQRILVQEGDEVSAGQRIATMGEGPGRRTMLHFEIRIDGLAVDPLQHLPPR